MESKFQYIFFLIFVLGVGSFLYKMFKSGGFKAAMFGSSIRQTIGEVSGNAPRFMSLSLRAHSFEDSTEKAVGLELVAKSVGSYKMTPVTLSVAEAKKLTQLLSEAAHGK